MEGQMILYPSIYLNNVKEITIELLKNNNIKGLLLDVDNTLIDFNHKILEGVKEWCEDLKKQGIKLCILSNTNKIEKVKKVKECISIYLLNFRTLLLYLSPPPLNILLKVYKLYLLVFYMLNNFHHFLKQLYLT